MQKPVGISVAVEEGRRVTTIKQGNAVRIRFISVVAKFDHWWQIASTRDFADLSIPPSGEQLKPLGWLIGNWVNEGADARVSIEYRWSEDKNFILGEITVTKNNQVVMKSWQRIGLGSTAIDALQAVVKNQLKDVTAKRMLDAMVRSATLQVTESTTTRAPDNNRVSQYFA